MAVDHKQEWYLQRNQELVKALLTIKKNLNWIKVKLDNEFEYVDYTGNDPKFTLHTLELRIQKMKKMIEALNLEA